MTVTHTEEQLQALCREWQGVLRLQDWDTYMRLCRANKMDDGHQGECEYTQSRKEAFISIIDPADYPEDAAVPQDMEQTLVHELLHIHFAPFFPTEKSEDDPERIAQEQAIDALAKALVRLKREAPHA